MNISVIIPAYNIEEYISRAIQSALSQTLPPVEILVIDDGSTDDTVAAVNRFGDRVTCITQPNSGPARARNRGIEAAQGRFVAFLDSDDEWHPDHLKRAARILSAYPFLSWYSAPTEIKSDKTGKTISLDFYTGPLVEEAYIEDYFSAEAAYPFISTITTLVRRDILLQIGGFREDLFQGEDKELWFRLALQDPRIGLDRKIGAIYWQRDRSITHSKRPDSVKKRFDHLLKLHETARKKGPEAVRCSHVLLIRYLRDIIRSSIKSNDIHVLRQITERFGTWLDPMDRALILIGSHIPGSIMDISARINSKVKPWLQKRL